MLLTRTHTFDDRNITWHRLEGIENLEYRIYAVDEERRIVDVMFKFAANKRVVLHKHHADYVTLVVQGELRIYRASGELKEVRPVGSYVATRAGGEPHFDGAGNEDAIVFFSNRGQDGVIYELLDESMNTLATLGMPEFKALMEAQ